MDFDIFGSFYAQQQKIVHNSPMRVLFADAEVVQKHAFRGIGSYALALRSALQRISSDPDLSFSLVNEQILEKPDLIHYPHADLFFRTLHPPANIPFVVTLHDVIPLVFPRQYPTGIKGKLRWLGQKKVLRKAAAIITDSECSKKDIEVHLRIPSKKIHVVPLAANEALHPQQKEEIRRVLDSFRIRQPYFLYVGDMNYNKNLPRLVRAFHASRLRASLVLVGRNLENRSIPEGKQLWDAIESGTGNVCVLTTVPSNPPDILASLFSGALAYVQPSVYEGFGLSVLDAFRCGCPVLSSSVSSLPEVYGTAAETFDPRDASDMVRVLRHAYCWTPAHRASLVKKGFLRESQFSWLETAQKTVDVYRKVLQALQ